MYAREINDKRKCHYNKRILHFTAHIHNSQLITHNTCSNSVPQYTVSDSIGIGISYMYVT